jgi:ClpP class serine protease
LEEERGSRVLTLIHRKEPGSASDDDPEIVLEDSEVILQAVRETPPDKPIDFIVHTEGGLTFGGRGVAEKKSPNWGAFSFSFDAFD